MNVFYHFLHQLITNFKKIPQEFSYIFFHMYMYKELDLLIKNYLYNDKNNRMLIKKKAYKLAKSKHTHIHRIQNVLDIKMGKTRKLIITQRK